MAIYFLAPWSSEVTARKGNRRSFRACKIRTFEDDTASVPVVVAAVELAAGVAVIVVAVVVFDDDALETASRGKF